MISRSSASTWIQGYTKRNAFCRSICNRKCYSNSIGSRHATSKNHDKRAWYRKRCNIKSYS